MRISDWSSDVCSSDLLDFLGGRCGTALQIDLKAAGCGHTGDGRWVEGDHIRFGNSVAETHHLSDERLRVLAGPGPLLPILHRDERCAGVALKGPGEQVEAGKAGHSLHDVFVAHIAGGLGRATCGERVGSY